MGRLDQTISGIYYRSPVVVASSPLTDKPDLIKQAEENGAGAASVKLTLLKQPNKGIRQMYYEQGYRFFNPSDKRNDLEPGLELVRKAKEATSDIVLWANIAGPGDDLEGWAEIAKLMEQAGADALELNFICPNMNFTSVNGQMVGALIGKNPVLVGQIVKKVKETVKIPVWVKNTSEVEDYLTIIRSEQEGGADGFVINGSPIVAPPIDIYKGGRTKMTTYNEKCSFGGCGGPVLRPLSQRLIGQVAKESNVPIAGGGGLETWEHAVEAIMFGASLVTFCTKFMVEGFSGISKINESLERFMEENNYDNIAAMRGSALDFICLTPELSNTYSYAKIDNDKCVGCGMCEKVGSCQAITIEDKKAVVNIEKCEGCGLCHWLCKKDAISFVAR